jgi:hypothetical protein
VVEADLPAKYAKNQRCGQVAIGKRKSVDGFAAQQIVRVRVAAINCEQHVEGGFASRGNFCRAILRRGFREPACP